MIWRYILGGKVRHALTRPEDVRAICGFSILSSYWWYGTGSQREYDTCAALPPCSRCVARGAR